MTEFTTIARLGDIPEGEGRAFEFHDQLVAVFNDGGQYRAIDDMCPHMGASLASGHLEGCIVTCPWHAWSFDTRDGTWCDNRRLKIDVYQVRVVGEEIQIAAIAKQPGDDRPAGGSALGGAPTSTDPNPANPIEGEHE